MANKITLKKGSNSVSFYTIEGMAETLRNLYSSLYAHNIYMYAHYDDGSDTYKFYVAFTLITGYNTPITETTLVNNLLDNEVACTGFETDYYNPEDDSYTTYVRNINTIYVYQNKIYFYYYDLNGTKQIAYTFSTNNVHLNDSVYSLVTMQ